jgi:hypothetical protein
MLEAQSVVDRARPRAFGEQGGDGGAAALAQGFTQKVTAGVKTRIRLADPARIDLNAPMKITIRLLPTCWQAASPSCAPFVVALGR